MCSSEESTIDNTCPTVPTIPNSDYRFSTCGQCYVGLRYIGFPTITFKNEKVKSKKTGLKIESDRSQWKFRARK
jgi:hypothetical protein